MTFDEMPVTIAMLLLHHNSSTIGTTLIYSLFPMSRSYHYIHIAKSQGTQTGVTSAKVPLFWKDSFISSEKKSTEVLGWLQ